MKAVGYIRVSTDRQATNGVSLDMQRQKITDYCTLNDFELVDVIEDAGLSGKSVDGRPGVQRAIELACSGEVQAVVVYKLDRLARNTIECLEISQRFDSCGASLHSICEKLDTSTAMGRFFFTLTASLAEMERGIISERTSAALAQKRANGERTGGQVPYGFVGTDDGRLLVDYTEQRTIDRVFELRSTGLGYGSICQKLFNEGYRSRKGGRFVRNQIVRILTGSTRPAEA